MTTQQTTGSSSAGPMTNVVAYTIAGTAGLDVQATRIGQMVDYKIEVGKGISPILYFTYVKKKFRLIEGMKMGRRVKKIEAAFERAIENGQSALAEKFLRTFDMVAREAALYAKGITHFITKEDLHKYKHKIAGGHISNTPFEAYTRVIPDDVIAKKKKVEELFDGFMIYHYWNVNADDVKDMTPDEKSKMKDPILFGTLNGIDRFYLIADWEDEFCDLTFDKLIDKLGIDEDDVSLDYEPNLE